MTERTPNPPEDYLKRWEDDILNEREDVDVALDCTWKDGYRAGADQELEACCEWLDRRLFDRDEIRALRTTRRPKPPSLKEQAQAALIRLNSGSLNANAATDKEIIRRALEQLND